MTFTRPYFGTASSMSKTLAVSTYSGGSSSRSWMLTRPAFRSRLSCARRVRISFARCSASIRWVSERSGAATAGLGGVFVAGGMGGESTSRTRGDKPKEANSAEPQVEVQPHGGHLTVTAGFAGLFQRRSCYARGRGSSVRRRRSRCLRSTAATPPRSWRPRAGRGTIRCRRRRDLRRRRAGLGHDVPVCTPPMPTIGIRTRARTSRTCASATARTAGPDTPPVPPPSHGSPGRRGCIAMPRTRVDRATRRRRRAPRPPPRPRPATRSSASA